MWGYKWCRHIPSLGCLYLALAYLPGGARRAPRDEDGACQKVHRIVALALKRRVFANLMLLLLLKGKFLPS